MNHHQQKKVIAFNTTKQETHTIENQFRKLHQSLRVRHKVVSHHNTNDETDLTFESIESYDVFIFANPQKDLSLEECNVISKFLNSGKSVAFLASGSDTTRTSYGDSSNNISMQHLPNIQNLLMEHGIKIENDTVVRTSFFKYLHPKQVYIDDGVLHPTLNIDSHSNFEEESSGHHKMEDSFDENSSLKVVYVNGCTLDTTSPSLPIFSSGALSFPTNRPIAAVAAGQRKNGKLVVVGSSDMFANEWIEKESNQQLFQLLINYLLHDERVTFDRSKSRKDNRIDDPKVVPDIEALSERLRCCLEENRPLPQDLDSLLIQDMFSYDTNMIPDVVDLYTLLNVKKEPLTLIPPEFERPIPPLRPAVFHPKMKELPFPALDKFDLDEEFAESSVRLARLTNSCSDEDLDYFVQEAGSISGLVDEQEVNVDAKIILHRLFKKVSCNCLKF